MIVLSNDCMLSYFSIEAVRTELNVHGVVVVANVVSSDCCDEYIDQLTNWLTRFGDDFPDNVHSTIQKYSLTHIDAAWRVRLQAKKIFSQLWHTEKLMSSSDSVAIGRPPESKKTKFGRHIPKDGLHYDQHPRRKGLHAYQGALYLEAAEEDDWCFAVFDKSHLHHQEFFSEFTPAEYDHRKLKKPEIEWFMQRSCTPRRIAAPKGGLILWDSRTVHAGAPPIANRKNTGRWRYIVFVCQTPAIWATDEDKRVKKHAYENLKCTRHWPSNGASCFDHQNTPYDIKEHPDIAKTEEVMLLAGVTEYDFDDDAPNGPDWELEWECTQE